MTAELTQITLRDGLFVASGYGLRISIERGQLTIVHGPPREREAIRFHRATSRLKRLVILGHTGTVSLDAMRWLHDVGAAFVQIDADGTVVVTTAPAGRNDAALRRAQALAPFNGVGMQIARDLIRQKLEGQARVLSGEVPVNHGIVGAIEATASALDSIESPEELRLAESMAARAYWATWAPIELRFARRDEPRLPEHWKTFGNRSSPLTNSPRRATNPGNALLNYLYALLEAECSIAILTLGLDPGLGFLHADQLSRDSLALDVMEAVRPEADRFVLQLLQSRVFAAREFFETRTGDCRLMPPLPVALAEHSRTFTDLVGPVVEDVARRLATAAPSWAPLTGALAAGARSRKSQRVPTLLSQSNRSAGRDGVRRRPKRQNLTLDAPTIASLCAECGSPTPAADRQYCDCCLVNVKLSVTARFAESGPRALAALRAAGKDPMNRADLREKVSVRRAQQAAADREWDRTHVDIPADSVFRDGILPRLQDVPLRGMMEATGLSKMQCSRIRRGIHVPHPRHWVALQGLSVQTREGA
ncbi:MAG: CRISPR-associated endonuclease Cas1 [Chloroflexi bacterium]|nr:CRISPR-associated endonuclease Cas1 [Chloroflexota bacterium]